MSDTLNTLNTDMWAILSAKADGEADEKMESCKIKEEACGDTYNSPFGSLARLTKVGV